MATRTVETGKTMSTKGVEEMQSNIISRIGKRGRTTFAAAALAGALLLATPFVAAAEGADKACSPDWNHNEVVDLGDVFTAVDHFVAGELSTFEVIDAFQEIVEHYGESCPTV